MKRWSLVGWRRRCVRQYKKLIMKPQALIAGHMTEIMQLLNLDLSDDSLMETPRIAENVRR
jgi:GTP cyclohydrolase I